MKIADIIKYSLLFCLLGFYIIATGATITVGGCLLHRRGLYRLFEQSGGEANGFIQRFIRLYASFNCINNISLKDKEIAAHPDKVTTIS